MNQHQYIRLLGQKLLTELPNHFPNGGAIFQQDGAPCHTAKSVKDFLRRNQVPLLDWHEPNRDDCEQIFMV